MSFSLDVNLLLYASDRSSPHHGKAVEFLTSVAEGRQACYVAWITVTSYLRMATHPRIFRAPLTQAEAEDNIGRLLALPHVAAISEKEGFWSAYRDVASGTPVRANLVPDAHLATILKQHGVLTLHTHDQDFRKFRFLRVVDPL